MPGYAKIRATLLGEDCVHVMAENGDIWRLSIGHDGLPVCEAYLMNAKQWPSEIVAEHERVTSALKST